MKKTFQEVFKTTLDNILLQWDKKLDREVTNNLPPHISLNDAKIMYCINSCAEKINMTQLLKLLNVTKGTLSVNIDKLSQKGYLLKESGVNDARATYLILTQKGVEIANLYEQNLHSIVSSIDENLNAYEKSLLLIALSKVEDILYE